MDTKDLSQVLQDFKRDSEEMNKRCLLRIAKEEFDRELKRADHSFNQIKVLSKITEKYNFSEQTSPLVHEYIRKSKRLQEKFTDRAKQDILPYKQGIEIAQVIAPITIGAVLGYAYSLTKTYFTGDNSNDSVGLGAMLGFSIELFFHPVAYFLTKQVTCKTAQEYLQEYRSLEDEIISKWNAE